MKIQCIVKPVWCTQSSDSPVKAGCCLIQVSILPYNNRWQLHPGVHYHRFKRNLDYTLPNPQLQEISFIFFQTHASNNVHLKMKATSCLCSSLSQILVSEDRCWNPTHFICFLLKLREINLWLYNVKSPSKEPVMWTPETVSSVSFYQCKQFTHNDVTVDKWKWKLRF